VRRLHKLDALRLFFAAYVVIGHATGWSGKVSNAGLAVDFFFILSGFVLSRLLIAKRVPAFEFFVMRVARLWPLHIVTMCAMIWISNVSDPKIVLANIFLLQNSGLLDHLSLNVPSWSISAEFSVGVLLFFPIVSRHMLIPAAALILISAALLMVFGPQRIDHLHEQRVFHIPFGLIRCTMGSLIGYVIYVADQQFIQQRRFGAWLDIVQVSFIAVFVVLMATPCTPGPLNPNYKKEVCLLVG